jgi:hypothetical protein
MRSALLFHSTDEELLQGVQRHDENSALAIFHRYSKIAFSVGLKILQDEGEAEDFVQGIFIRFYSEANTFESGKGSARTWIILMIYRRAFDRRGYLHWRRILIKLDFFLGSIHGVFSARGVYCAAFILLCGRCSIEQRRDYWQH